MQATPGGNLIRSLAVIAGLVSLPAGAGFCQTVAAASTASADPSRTVRQLNVTIVEFDTGLETGTEPGAEVFPAIRRIEAKLIPYLLRTTLEATGQWGAVRVQPDPHGAAELAIAGVIDRSDGVTMTLSISATDSSGRRWLHRAYTHTPVANDSDDAAADTGAEPFQPVYDDVAADLLRYRDTLDDRELEAIATIATLKYARDLAPLAFADFLDEDSGGATRLRRLPASGDPMLERILRIRDYEYLFTDVADEKYRAYFDELSPAYTEWRKYRRRIANFRESEAKRLEKYGNTAPRGSYDAIRRSYDNYRRAKMQEQNLQKWAAAFDKEAAPNVMELEGQVVALQGDLGGRYREWRRLLRELFLAETGGIGGPAPPPR